VDVSANGEMSLTVRRGSSSSKLKGSDLVRKQGEGYLVDTGMAWVQVGVDQRDGFRITSKQGEALLDERPALVVYSTTGDEFRSVSPDKVELENSGPLYASIFLAGPMKAKDSQYGDILRWETRLHF